MSRPRTPTHLLELRGAFKINPQRRRERENEPRPSGPLGDAPEYFQQNPELYGIWLEISGAVPEGVLTNADAFQVELASGLLYRYRRWMRGEIMQMQGVELSQLNNLLGKLGLNPSDRAKLSVPKKEDKQNDGLDFLN